VGIKIKAELDGVEETFEVLGDFDYRFHTHAITSGGTVVPKDIPHYEKVRLRLVRKQHTWGGVVFEEVETRDTVNFGEWYSLDGRPAAYHHDAKATRFSFPVTILRHVCGDE
jgi:hypothetical protein